MDTSIEETLNTLSGDVSFQSFGFNCVRERDKSRSVNRREKKQT